jgi:hypothetical protein
MLPITSVIPAPIPDHLFLDHDMGLIFAALLIAFVVSAAVALLSAGTADRPSRAADEAWFLEQLAGHAARRPVRAAKRKRHSLAA